MKKLLLFITLSTQIFAQKSILDSTFQLKEVEVYGSKTQQKANEIGRNVTILTAKDIQKYPANSIDDLLRLLPSIEVQSRGAFGSQSDILMRASTFNQVLMLLDGMRLNDPLTGHFNGNIPVPISEIEQIEVIRGAGSAMYGADAVGGVINIVTKTFAQKQQKQTSGQIAAQYGEWDFLNINAGVHTQSEKFKFGVGILQNQSKGQPLDAPSTQRSQFNLGTLSLSGAYQVSSKINVATRASFDRRDFNAQWFYTTSTIDLSHETTNRNWWQGQIRMAHSAKQVTELQYVNSYSTDLYVFNPSFTPSSHQMWFSNAQMNHFVKFSDDFKMAVGGQLDKRRIMSNDRGNHETNHFGLYTTATYQKKGLIATLGGRFDNDQSYGSEFSPELNVSYILPKIVLRGAIGKSIRAADFTERYVSNNLPGPLSAGRSIGFANLQAERAINTELGVDYHLFRGLTFKATAFARNGKNLIDYVPLQGNVVIQQTGLTNVAADRSYRLAQNLFEVQIRGLEMELWLTKNLCKNVIFEGNVGLTLLDTKNAAGVVSQYLSNFAKSQVNGSMQLSYKGIRLSLSGLHRVRNEAAAAAISRKLTPKYTVFHSKIEAKIWKNVSATAQVQNLFDVSYADILGAQMPRRWLMGGLTVGF